MEKAELERRWMELREKYNKLVDGRCLLHKLDIFEFRRDTRWFKRNEDRILRQIESVRKKLHAHDPETHIFKKNKTLGRGGLTRRGDNGYILCPKCFGLFETSYKHKDYQKTEFVSCLEHIGRKKIGSFTSTEIKIVY